jgi:hypothetical protein
MSLQAWLDVSFWSTFVHLFWFWMMQQGLETLSHTSIGQHGFFLFFSCLLLTFVCRWYTIITITSHHRPTAIFTDIAYQCNDGEYLFFLFSCVCNRYNANKWQQKSFGNFLLMFLYISYSTNVNSELVCTTIMTNTHINITAKPRWILCIWLISFFFFSDNISHFTGNHHMFMQDCDELEFSCEEF